MESSILASLIVKRLVVIESKINCHECNNRNNKPGDLRYKLSQFIIKIQCLLLIFSCYQPKCTFWCFMSQTIWNCIQQKSAKFKSKIFPGPALTTAISGFNWHLFLSKLLYKVIIPIVHSNIQPRPPWIHAAIVRYWTLFRKLPFVLPVLLLKWKV